MFEFVLVLVAGSATGQFVIASEEMFILGNSQTSDLRFPAEPQGSFIAALVSKGNGLSLRRLGGSSRLLVNDQPVNDYQPVFHGDYITVGSAVLKIELRAMEDEPLRAVKCDGSASDERCNAIGELVKTPPFNNAGWLCDHCADRRADRKLWPHTALGGFDLLRKVGTGAFGTVYEAIHRGTGAHAAVKIADKDGKDNQALIRFVLREQAIHQSVVHPNIVRYYASGAKTDTFYVAMEYMVGGAITDVRAPMPYHHVLSIAVDLFQALDYLHAQGYVHRDVKPQNVLLGHSDERTGAPRAKLSDFGCAKLTTDSFDLTAKDVIGGSLYYAAPEQIRNFKNSGRESDMYSAAATVYWMLAGRPPLILPQSAGMNEIERMSMQARVVLNSQRDPLLSTRRPFYAHDESIEAVADLIDKLVARDSEARSTIFPADVVTALKRHLK
jgi:eukaryotic-like serine/threonine-protein kinase